MPKIRHQLLTRLCLTATLLLLSLTAIATPLAEAEDLIFSEYQVRTAYILNFIRFTTWPKSSFKDAQQDIVLGIVGKDFFGTTIDAIDGKYIKNRHLRVVRLSKNDNPQDCHLLYISSSEHRHLKQILAEIQGEPILTISDIDNFAKDGGIVQIKRIGDKIKLFINTAATSAAGLQLRANLLKIATLVGQ